MSNAKKAKLSPIREGLISLVVSGIAAAISTTAILTWWHMAESTATIESGGPAFAANLGPAVNSLLGILLGVIALLLTACSIGFSEKRFPKSFTFCHFCSLVLLIPSGILLTAMFTK
ncbi:MAG: hypothetical protein ACSHX7_09735 [Luteolibacter sp.]